MIDRIFSLRRDFMIIGLTGKTGSGCSTVADLLTVPDIHALKSNFPGEKGAPFTNQLRKDRIIRNFIDSNWVPFTKITASDIIYYFAAQLPFEDFVKEIARASVNHDTKEDKKGVAADADEKVEVEPNLSNALEEGFKDFKEHFDRVSALVKEVDEFVASRGYDSVKNMDEDSHESKMLHSAISLIESVLPEFRKMVEELIDNSREGLVPVILQNWGNNIRKFKSIADTGEEKEDAPSALAAVINRFIKCIRVRNSLIRNEEGNKTATRIVIDALRNPFEILYFRERYAAFYCMSVNTTDKIRHENLMISKNLRHEEIKALDKKEGEKKELNRQYQEIDVIRCIELSDIFLYHNGEEAHRNRNLINQILTYISLILHPGLVPPSHQERAMQVAFTAKLNSGCLSRQVGAVVTDSNFSIKSVGWNSVPEGQVPCSIRRLDDLVNREDVEAFSDYELQADYFHNYAVSLRRQYLPEHLKKLRGVPLTYCFKNIHTKQAENQLYNQVHTRSLHAEENAFLQLVKYGGQGIEGGKLFTTASCCELCAKKAYHLGIREIYYIDSYPGISEKHIFHSGREDRRPRLKLFSGAVGRAYINLYSPFVPLKDEIEYVTNVKVGSNFSEGKSDKATAPKNSENGN